MGLRRELEGSCDQQLVAAMCRGERMALEILYDRHGHRVLALAYRMVGLRGPAEEVVKAAFQSIWAERASYRPGRGSVRNWLLRVTRETAVDVLRRVVWTDPPAGSGVEDAAREPPADELADRRAARQAGNPRLLPAFADARPVQSRVIELAYFGGYDLAEIAAMLDVPAHTVKRHMRAALVSLDRDRPEYLDGR